MSARGWPQMAIVVIALTVAGCSGASESAPTASPHTFVIRRSVSSPPPHAGATVPPAKRSIVSLLNSGIYPQCSDAVGLPTRIVVQGHNVTTGEPEVRCRTGAGDNDATVVARTTCGPASPTAVYYWASGDRKTADQHVYAALAGYVVRRVPGVVAPQLHAPATLAAVRRTAGC